MKTQNIFNRGRPADPDRLCAVPAMPWAITGARACIAQIAGMSGTLADAGAVV